MHLLPLQTYLPTAMPHLVEVAEAMLVWCATRRGTAPEILNLPHLSLSVNERFM